MDYVHLKGFLLVVIAVNKRKKKVAYLHLTIITKS